MPKIEARINPFKNPYGLDYNTNDESDHQVDAMRYYVGNIGINSDFGEAFLSGGTNFPVPKEIIKYITIPISTHSVWEIDRVIFNNPAVIIIWMDGTKTVVKKSEDDEWDPEKGIAMAIVKKYFGNTKFMKKYIEKEGK